MVAFHYDPAEERRRNARRVLAGEAPDSTMTTDERDYIEIDTRGPNMNVPGPAIPVMNRHERRRQAALARRAR